MDQNTVLVVDDNEDIRESLQLLLADEGYDIVTADDGQKALDLIPLLPNPAVILLDLQMPRLDGYGVLLDLSKHPEMRDRISIFLLTANYRPALSGHGAAARKRGRSGVAQAI